MEKLYTIDDMARAFHAGEVYVLARQTADDIDCLNFSRFMMRDYNVGYVNNYRVTYRTADGAYLSKTVDANNEEAAKKSVNLWVLSLRVDCSFFAIERLGPAEPGF